MVQADLVNLATALAVGENLQYNQRASVGLEVKAISKYTSHYLR